MYGYYQKDTIVDLDGFKYKLVKYYDDDIRAEIIECHKYDAIIRIPSHIVYSDVEYPVTRIKENAFQRKSLKSIIVGENVTVIEKRCFQDCSELEKVVLSEKIEYLGENCFWDCEALKDINLPDRISTLGSHCFYGCKSLTKVVLPSKSCHIGNDCFSMCRSLQTVILPEEIRELGSSCFSWCDKLESIKLPSTLTRISSYAFNCCKSLKSVIIPENVKRLDSGCFSGCDSLTEIKIPASVEVIDYYAFHGCGSLKRVSIMNKNVELGHDCFSECPLLVDVVIHGGNWMMDDVCVDLCPSLSDETRSHIRQTEEGKKREEERSLKGRIKTTSKKAWDLTQTALVFLLIAPFLLVGYLIFGFTAQLLAAVGGIVLSCYILGLLVILALGLLVDIEHKFDWKYNCACIFVGAIILGLIFLFGR